MQKTVLILVLSCVLVRQGAGFLLRGPAMGRVAALHKAILPLGATTSRYPLPDYDTETPIDLSQYDDDDYGDEEDEMDVKTRTGKGKEDIDFLDIDPSKKPAGNKGVFNDQEWMFFDVARINVKGGEGGDGCMAMRREYCLEFGGPAGGNGGHGGSVYLECDSDLNTLAMLRRKVHHRGKDGTNGKGSSLHGQRGTDAVIPVPPGTIVRDQDGKLAGELNNHGQRMLVAKGGRGGRGNEHFKTPRNKAPAFAEKGAQGAERWLGVELKLIADVGFIGVPNAGKSTLLKTCSNAKPKVADYPFTTITPNLGICDIDTKGSYDQPSKGLVLADIPGLLEGAHDGKGLGLSFLRHVQRCRVLVHVIRGDSEDPVGDFQAINEELRLFNPELVEKPQVVVINKIDIPEVEVYVDDLTKELKKAAGHSRVVGISALAGSNVKMLMQRVRKMVDSLPEQESYNLYTDDKEERVSFEALEDLPGFDTFKVIMDDDFPGQYRVIGDRIEGIVATTNWDYYEAVQRFQRILEAQGISDALKECGALQGDLIMIGDFDFNYFDRKNRWVAEMGMENINPRERGENKSDAR